MFEWVNRIVFSVFLLVAAWQDGREKSIRMWVFITAGTVGGLLSFLQGNFGVERIFSCLIGCGILILSRLTDEAIGAGDGCFFAVSGFYLSASLNLKLLVYGTFLCGFVCTGIYIYSRLGGRDTRKKSVPFLPFLVPVWFLMVML